MSIAREAIVHIGAHKTGTSFIQRRFHEHRVALREHGIVYPFDEPNHSYAMSGLFGRREQVQPPSPRDRYRLAPDAALRALDADLSGSDWTRLMISGEVLSTFSQPELEGLRDWLAGRVDTIRVVLVVRDPVDWAVSVAQELLKTRGDVAKVLATPSILPTRAIVRRVRAVFGAESLMVLEYERLALMRERFAARFAGAVGLSAPVAAMLRAGTKAGVNESLSMEAALMLGRYNARVPQQIEGVRNPARSGLEPGAFAGLPGARFDLPDAARRLAFERSRPEIAFLAQEFGIRRYGYPASRIAPSGYSEQVSAEFVDALADRLVSVSAAAAASRMLLEAQELRERGDHASAAALLRRAAGRFPRDRRIARALARTSAE